MYNTPKVEVLQEGQEVKVRVMCEDKRNVLLDVLLALIRSKLLLLELQSNTENSAYGKVRYAI